MGTSREVGRDATEGSGRRKGYQVIFYPITVVHTASQAARTLKERDSLIK